MALLFMVYLRLELTKAQEELLFKLLFQFCVILVSSKEYVFFLYVPLIIEFYDIDELFKCCRHS